MEEELRRLDGKTALVTAAGQGIGRAIAELFSREGATVWATDLDQVKLTGLDSCNIARMDVLDVASIDTVLRAAGPLDVLCNCAGYVANGTILDCDERDWSFSFDLNVTSMYHVTQRALPPMLKKGSGSIVNISSIASSVKGIPNRFAYGTTKAAIIGLTKSIAADFVGYGIRCNAICPGTVDTPSLQDRLRATGNYDKAKGEFIARQPMGRLGTAEEIAALALYLASDDSAFTTGQPHIIDGGWVN
jgi:2-keto-3-deoxy-L-fuconate dehydrogenase